MARPLVISALLFAATFLALTANAVPLTEEEIVAEKVNKLDRRRTPQQCLQLGFISDQLECETCEQLKEAFVDDGLSRANRAAFYDDHDIYFECKSCCTKGKLEGDAMRLPTDGTATATATSSSSSSNNNNSGKKGVDGSKDAPLPIPPYILPQPTRYAKARCEISMMNFEQSDDWNRLLMKVEKLFPLPPNAADKKKDGTDDNEKSSSSSSKNKNKKKNADPATALRHDPALIEIHPVYQRQSHVLFYTEEQKMPVGHPAALEEIGDEPHMKFEVSSWDANKLVEFLNNTIKGSAFLKEKAEKEEAEAKKRAEADAAAAAAVANTKADDEL